MFDWDELIQQLASLAPSGNVTNMETSETVPVREAIRRELVPVRAEVERLQAELAETEKCFDEANERLVEHIDEIERLQTWKADVEDSTKAAMDESCDANERHCTCVPLLRAEVKRLRKEWDWLWAFLSESLCECYDEYGEKRPQPCDRCRLLTKLAAEAGGQ